jgi:hypothetical protein
MLQLEHGVDHDSMARQRASHSFDIEECGENVDCDR